jgi:cbb3-type cytochrome oxidase subunit 3
MQEFVHIVLWLRAYSIVPVMGVFILIAAAAYWPGRRESVERDGLIPFLEDR